MRSTAAGLAGSVLVLLLTSAPAAGQDRAARDTAAPRDPAVTARMVTQALKAAPPGVAEDAAVMDWQGNTLREGTNGWTCFPDPPNMASSPMCMDEPWLAWGQAWQNREPASTDRIGVAYMLLGDAGASNVDPYATGPTADNQWVETGPHLMIIAPDPAMFEGFPTDPAGGGPWVMWEGTPYVHLMVPVEVDTAGQRSD